MVLIILLVELAFSQISPSVSFCNYSGGLSPNIISLNPDPPIIGYQTIFVNATVLEPGLYPNAIFANVGSIPFFNSTSPNVTVGQYNLYSLSDNFFQFENLRPGIWGVQVTITDDQGFIDLCFEYDVTIPYPTGNGGNTCMQNYPGYFNVYNITFSPSPENPGAVHIYGAIDGADDFLVNANVSLYSQSGTLLSSLLYNIRDSNSTVGSFNNFTFPMQILPSKAGNYYYEIQIYTEYMSSSVFCWKLNLTVDTANLIILNLLTLVFSLIV